MFRFVRKPKNKVTTTKQLPFVRNQNFIKHMNCNTKYNSEFHSCMRNVMRLCRWVGLFPVEGLERSSWNKLKFNLKSFYGICYIASILGLLLNTIVSLIKIFQFGATLLSLSGTIFYCNGVVSVLLLFITAKKWFLLVQKAAALETTCDIRINAFTSKKILFLAYIVSVFGIIEYCLAANYVMKYIKGCNPNYSFREVLIAYLKGKLPYKISHNDIVQTMFQIYLEVTGRQGTFLRSFTDVVNISMSTYLIAHFEELNKQIFAQKDNLSTNWRKLRLQQAILVQLVHLINDHFKYFVLLSCLSTLYFMCVQLYNSLSVLQSFDHHAYFFFSFLYLMFKSLTFSRMAANVNAVAQEPLIALFSIHPSIYGIEIQRFYSQINYTTIAVSGAFFYLSRAAILKVISSVVTYELMLIQINNRKHTNHLWTFHTAKGITNNNTIFSVYSSGNVSLG